MKSHQIINKQMGGQKIHRYDKTASDVTFALEVGGICATILLYIVPVCQCMMVAFTLYYLNGLR